ncbi:unnamed protein product [Somion occarium]|uniref:Beta-glucuronidase C-terminal domain-containing protein n=1 Tax=Somion occarium TaxID=3059160 RepID=A0ABP1D1R9_9APHY
MKSLVSLYITLACNVYASLAAIEVTPPSSPPTGNATAVVFPNFLGISLELSFINNYFGNSSNEAPPAMVNYLSAIRNRTFDRPVRLRLGGNSMDSSTYVPDQQDIIQFTNPNANSNDQPVNYGPALFDVMNTVSDMAGEVEYLIGLSLRNPNSTNIALLAGDAQKALGDKLDAYLLGNEPDLYTRHGQRPNIANYTVNDYIGEYWTVFNQLKYTPQGDVLELDKIAGPTICCAWDLNAVLSSGWLTSFKDRLKYITLQHYPQDNCRSTHKYELDYYLQHKETVELAQWQGPGIHNLSTMPPEIRRPLLMDEFSSASCGGLPGISDTFGAAMWTVDYALQMASVGYSAAYLHTRERGVTYNLFDYPDAPAGSGGDWTTNPTFYAYLPIAEALQSPNGSKVVDLDIENSMTDATATIAGYAIYDMTSSNVHRVVLFNFVNGSSTPVSFSLSPSFFSTSSNSVLVRYLTAPNVNEKTQIAWGNLTYAGVGDGNPIQATFDTARSDQTVDCSQGCTIDVPGPAVAVVYVGAPPILGAVKNSTSQTTGSGATSHSGTLGLRLPSATSLLLLSLPFVHIFSLL